MSRKQYRVICSKERFKDDVIIDIAPADGVIHEVIFASRKKENPKLENYGGPIYLTDIDGQKPEITFGDFKLSEQLVNAPARKSPMYMYYESLARELTPKIVETFNKMKAAGKEATLDVCMMDYLASKQDGEVKTLQDEELKEYAERRRKIEQYKKETIERRENEKSACKPEVLLAWKQALQRGD